MKRIFRIIIFIISNIPIFCFFPWILQSWFNSPLDKINPIWGLAAVLLVVINIKQIYKSADKADFIALLLLIPSIILFIGFNFLQINILALISALLISLSIIWLIFGWKCFIIIIPIYAVFAFSFPTTSYIISYFYSKFSFSMSLSPELIKAFLLIFPVLFSLLYPRQKRYSITKINGIYWLFFIASIALIIFYYSPDTLLSPPLNIKVSLTPNSGWYGEKYKLSNIENKLYSDTSVKKLMFYNKNGYTITALIFETDGNPHKIHPPDYCLRGAGWSILSENYFDFKIKNSDFIVRSLVAELYNHKELIVSWYSSNSISTGDFKAFRLNQRKSGDNWKSYLLSINVLTDNTSARKELINFITMYSL